MRWYLTTAVFAVKETTLLPLTRGATARMTDTGETERTASVCRHQFAGRVTKGNYPDELVSYGGLQKVHWCRTG